MAGMNINGEQIKEARERLHMTQTELAEVLGVSLRTIGSWERGESVPRSRMGAIREVLKMEGPEDNRGTLGRLIREELDDSGRGPVQVTKGWPAGNIRSFYTWKDGITIPLRKSRGMLEDALRWRRGVVTDILEAPITQEFTLSDVRDWSAMPEHGAVALSGLGTDELLTELSHRFWGSQERIKALEGELAALRGNVVQLPARESMDMYDVAANNTDPARMMEHLEDVDSPS